MVDFHDVLWYNSWRKSHDAEKHATRLFLKEGTFVDEQTVALVLSLAIGVPVSEEQARLFLIGLGYMITESHEHPGEKINILLGRLKTSFL